MEKSLIELAYEFVKENKTSVSFSKIWAYIKSVANLSEEEANRKAGQFYTNLLLDGRLVNLGNNEWDLRERNTFEKVHIDMKDVYSDVETTDEDSEEASEEKEYNEAFEEKNDLEEEGKDGFGDEDDSSTEENL